MKELKKTASFIDVAGVRVDIVVYATEKEKISCRRLCYYN